MDFIVFGRHRLARRQEQFRLRLWPAIGLDRPRKHFQSLRVSQKVRGFVLFRIFQELLCVPIKREGIEQCHDLIIGEIAHMGNSCCLTECSPNVRFKERGSPFVRPATYQPVPVAKSPYLFKYFGERLRNFFQDHLVQSINDQKLISKLRRIVKEAADYFLRMYFLSVELKGHFVAGLGFAAAWRGQ